MPLHKTILILYTTLYREGGDKFTRAALTMEADKKAEFPGHQIVRKAVESKAHFVQELQNNGSIEELHFIGHSGMYGIMFGSRQWPEQMSPFEWKNLQIPFAEGARAYFHACRTGRWFADFFARTFNVTSYGYFWYTSISSEKNRFAWDRLQPEKPLYIISVPGKKSHGFTGSLQKYLTKPTSYPLLEFKPVAEKIDTTYDSVSNLYDSTFEDISVREDELRWLRGHLKQMTSPRVLDIGCGTGSFLRALSDLVESAEGVDLSQGMINEARKRAVNNSKLKFNKIDGPLLPFPDNSFDAVTSILSFRYLDWDPIMAEILRVLKPGGHLMIVDMVAAPLTFAQMPKFLVDKFRHKWMEFKNPRYRLALHKMVSTREWKKMLAYNPIRSEHEMKWYLQSRFPEGEIKNLNYAWQSRIMAFKSAPIRSKTLPKMSFP